MLTMKQDKKHRSLKMKTVAKALMVLIACLALSSCYHKKENKQHYGRNYNFVIKADSMAIIEQQPEEIVTFLPTDTLYVRHNDHIVVADKRILNNDTTDSVWVQVARDQETFGWVHESVLLKSVVPSDPISQFISTFSDKHLLIFLVIISVIASGYLLRRIMKKKAFIVHFNDIDSIYPTLLAITVAAAATFYSSIQLFDADSWQHFYFHPSLNPFSQPPIIGIFVGAVWAMLIMGMAALDEVKRLLPVSQAILYLGGLAAICAANYIIFSITTLYYIGFPLLVAYIGFALYRYIHYTACSYICGKCGKKMKRKGKCPHCGAENR